METTFINESELLNKFIGKSNSVNNMLLEALNEYIEDYKINPDYVGGLECVLSNGNLSLGQNIDNLFAAYKSNFLESIFFQFEYIKMMKTLDLVQEFLVNSGLDDQFRKYRSNWQSKEKPRLSGTTEKDKNTLNI